MEGTGKRLHVCFEGQVQGVGFRYTVLDLAAGLELDGYVMNMADGTVELVAEAEEQRLFQLLDRIHQSRLQRYITREHVNWSRPHHDHQGFRIRHY